MKVCLIVEDNPVNRVVAQNMVQKMGFYAVSCENGRQAIDYCKVNPLPELILLDGYMPEMNGLEFLRAFKKLPDSDQPLIVFSSSSMDRNDVEEALHIGAHYHIPKPIDKELLSAALKNKIAA